MKHKRIKASQSTLTALVLSMLIILVISEDDTKKYVLYFILGGAMCLLQKPLNFI